MSDKYLINSKSVPADGFAKNLIECQRASSDLYQLKFCQACLGEIVRRVQYSYRVLILIAPDRPTVLSIPLPWLCTVCSQIQTIFNKKLIDLQSSVRVFGVFEWLQLKYLEFSLLKLFFLFNEENSCAGTRLKWKQHHHNSIWKSFSAVIRAIMGVWLCRPYQWRGVYYSFPHYPLCLLSEQLWPRLMATKR